MGRNAVDDFGAAGDCHSNASYPATRCTDDGPALQRAIDAAQRTRRVLFVPAGQYMISEALIVHSNQNHSELVDGNYIHGPLRSRRRVIKCPPPLTRTQTCIYGHSSWPQL
jgi:hypothetical protein